MSAGWGVARSAEMGPVFRQVPVPPKAAIRQQTQCLPASASTLNRTAVAQGRDDKKSKTAHPALRTAAQSLPTPAWRSARWLARSTSRAAPPIVTPAPEPGSVSKPARNMVIVCQRCGRLPSSWLVRARPFHGSRLKAGMTRGGESGCRSTTGRRTMEAYDFSNLAISSLAGASRFSRRSG